MSGITVTFGTIGQAQADVSNTVGRMNGQLDELRAFLAPLISTWEGGASSDYQVLQRRWDTAAADLNTVLMQISQLLGNANQGYQATEMANAAAWG
ncbi:MAG: WXG100 family type VII secretion target [Actinomycetota bacterium]